MSWQTRFRVACAVVVVVSTVVVGYGYATGAGEQTVEQRATGESVAPPASGVTVVATDSNSWLGRGSERPRAVAELFAIGPSGDLLYYNRSHTRYWDVDPVAGTETTVEYVFSDHLDECPEFRAAEFAVDRRTWAEYGAVQREVDACTLNGVERVNLSTGEVTRIWSQVTPGKAETRYHDVDRINDTHLLVADIYLDRVFVVETATGAIEWRWNVSDAFDPAESGGPYPEDWSHLNDVELLGDRILVSLRNHDRVVVLNRSGLLANWTLGAEDDYDTLYEQHNPDYLPPARGGPAIVVADSENDRLVEYQRASVGGWKRTWTWRDAELRWPRDADRLPNGHTLVTDSNGNRVFEVDERGRIVWRVTVGFPYEAERLGTGDESAGGASANQSGLESRTPALDERVWITLAGLVPGRTLNGVMYATPVWLGVPELVAVVVGGLCALAWASAEGYWAVTSRVRSASVTRETTRTDDD